SPITFGAGFNVDARGTSRTWAPIFRIAFEIHPQGKAKERIILDAAVLSPRVLAGARREISRTLRIDALVGGGTDLMRVTPVGSTDPSITLASPGLRATATLRGGFLFGYHGSFRIALSVFVDVDVVQANYVIASRAGSSSDVTLTFPVRPLFG